MNDQGEDKNEDWGRRFLRGILQLMDTKNCILCEVSMAEWNRRRLFFVSNDECRNLPQSAAEDMNCLEAVEVWKLDMLG